MTEINKKGHKKGWPLWIFILPVIDFVLLLRYLLQGKNIAVLNPKGHIAQEQHKLIVFTAIVLVAVVIPTLILMFYLAWRYNENNAKQTQAPVANRSKSLVLTMWLFPTAVMVLLASVMIPATHKLAPQKNISASAKPLTIQVISLRWKWLFIYPEQGIATINYVQLPVDTPVTFEMTADETPMSSFWIPNLGGQLYTMTGHVNRLNLMADTVGDYPGSSAELNGAGFSKMKFTAHASDSATFDRWIEEVKASPDSLDELAYKKLLIPTEANPTMLFSNYKDDLYDKVIMKYHGSSEEHAHEETSVEEGHTNH